MGKTRLLVVATCAAALVGVGASAAFAGEITGNGGPTGAPANSNSDCSFSGQEDLQWFTNDGDKILKPGGPTKGDPAHSQSWGQLDKATRAFLTSIGVNPGIACNGNLNGLKK